jgi:hypothetical protein
MIEGGKLNHEKTYCGQSGNLVVLSLLDAVYSMSNSIVQRKGYGKTLLVVERNVYH